MPRSKLTKPGIIPRPTPLRPVAPAASTRAAMQALRKLTTAVSIALAQLDVVMAAPATSEARGRAIAKIANALDIANDSALHSDLGVSFPSIIREKSRLRTVVRQSLDAEYKTRGAF